MNSLRDLYSAHLKQISAFAAGFPNAGLYGPLLMEPTAYFKQPIKLLVVGQETAGWSKSYDDVDAQLEVYRGFNLGAKWQGPFWGVTRKVETALGIDRCACAWSNLNRFDQNKKAPVGEVLEKMPSLDFLLREEIRILKPDVCLFYTNRKYDHRLKELYFGVQFSAVDGLPGSHFARLFHPKLPTLTLRTPHPKSMRIRKQEAEFIKVLGSLFSVAAARPQ